MTVDLDDEILQDFLVEAGEILELLGEQLVELEQAPEDQDLLNAIFRGFHTVKGGAGFLALEPLVEVCHKAEDVFNVLRQGDRKVSSELMDVILEVVDIVNEMFSQVRSGMDPDEAEPDLLSRLQIFTSEGGGNEGAADVESEIEQEPAVEEPSEEEVAEPAPVLADMVEQEFEAMLDDTQAESSSEQTDDLITEDEFDDLLDQLHGKGQFSSDNLQLSVENLKPAEETSEPDVIEHPDVQSAHAASMSVDEISENEFDDLLDELHGKGQFSAKKLLSEEDATAENAATASNDKSGEITEQEFDHLLDELHGEGKFSAKSLIDESDTAQDSASKKDNDDITEEEFDHLLDELHGDGKFSAKELLGSNADRSVSAKEPAAVENSKSKVKVNKSSEDASKSKQTEPEIKPAKKETQTEKNKPEEKEKTSKPVKAEKAETKKAAVKTKPAKSVPAQGGKQAVQANQGETTVRVDTFVLDDIMNMVGELVLVRNRFQTLKSASDNENEAISNEQLTKAVANLDVVTADLQLAVMKTRMQPIKKVFGRFPRVVRDLSRSLKKEIKLELVGEETDLDKNLVEALADPLVHLIRNAVDHGIEYPDERTENGKPRVGTVILTASQEGDHIQLSIKDDGKGMNADKLRAAVVEKGLMDEESAARLDPKECYNLIFMPGFSTKQEISDVSGRGVGMDVVKTRITQMNGVVEIDSEEGEGTTIIIKVPLTLAIMPTLMVVLGGQAFALPLASVLEILDLDLSATNVVDGQLVIMVRERALPVFFLSDWLVNDPGYSADRKGTAHVVVVNSGGRSIGFVVDQLIGQEEVVIKPLGAKLQGLDGLAGATITGDGKIALILDVPGLMTKYAS